MEDPPRLLGFIGPRGSRLTFRLTDMVALSFRGPFYARIRVTTFLPEKDRKKKKSSSSRQTLHHYSDLRQMRRSEILIYERPQKATFLPATISLKILGFFK